MAHLTSCVFHLIYFLFFKSAPSKRKCGAPWSCDEGTLLRAQFRGAGGWGVPVPSALREEKVRKARGDKCPKIINSPAGAVPGLHLVMSTTTVGSLLLPPNLSHHCPKIFCSHGQNQTQSALPFLAVLSPEGRQPWSRWLWQGLLGTPGGV